MLEKVSSPKRRTSFIEGSRDLGVALLCLNMLVFLLANWHPLCNFLHEAVDWLKADRGTKSWQGSNLDEDSDIFCFLCQHGTSLPAKDARALLLNFPDARAIEIEADAFDYFVFHDGLPDSEARARAHAIAADCTKP